MTELPAVGFIGLGAMGGAMAMRLADAGVALHVSDPSPQACAPFAARGATVHATPAAVAARVDIVFACLPNAAVSAAVATGSNGVASGGRAAIYVEMSTIGRRALEPIAASLQAAGITLVDAPVSGGPRGARAGTLSAMVAGPPSRIEAIRPYLGIMAKSIFVIGEVPGLAQTMKLVNNLIGAANMASAFEALVFGAKAGIDPDLMVEVINASTGRNSATLDKIPQSVLPGTFDYGARLDIMYKDITLGLAEAEAAGVPMWTLGAVAQLWQFAMLQGDGARDFTCLIQHIERWAGAQVRGAAARGHEHAANPG